MKNSNHNKTLLIGIGNYGRQDDGLGWKFLDEIRYSHENYDVEYRYQLQVEDAELISHYETVVFIDSFNGNLENGFSFYECQPQPTYNFTTHSLKPEQVVWLAGQLFGDPPKTHVLAIKGLYWNLICSLSEPAKKNLKNAVNFFDKMASNADFIKRVNL